MPIVLALQAVLFYLPNLLWTALQWRTGFRIDDIVQRAQDAQKGGLIDRVQMNDLAVVFECSLGVCFRNFEMVTNRNNSSIKGTVARMARIGFLGRVWRRLARFGCWTTGVYIASKVLYLLNSAGQLLLLNYFLGQHRHKSFWGAHVRVVAFVRVFSFSSDAP